MGLPDGENFLKICLFVLTWSTNVTDRQTHRHRMTAMQYRPSWSVLHFLWVDAFDFELCTCIQCSNWDCMSLACLQPYRHWRLQYIETVFLPSNSFSGLKIPHTQTCVCYRDSTPDPVGRGSIRQISAGWRRGRGREGRGRGRGWK